MEFNKQAYAIKDAPERVALMSQVASEFKVARDFMQPKREEWRERLRLYNNQKRKKGKVGEPLLFSTFNTVLAAFWDDKLNAIFKARNEGDVEKAEKLTALAKYDYYVMRKAELDYDRMWDTKFFGIGLVFTPTFDTKYNVPVNYVIDPMTFFFDPSADTLTPRPGMRGGKYWGRQLLKSTSEIKKNKEYNWSDEWTGGGTLGGGGDQSSDLAQAQRARADARGQNYQGIGKVTGNNADVLVTEWYTYVDGDIYMVEVMGDLGKDEATVQDNCNFLRVEKMKWKEFPLTEYRCWRMPHEFIGVSIPDLIEDKQRIMAKFLNLAVEGAEFDVYNMQLVDKTKVKMEQVGVPKPNKLIPVDGDTTGAMRPVERSGVRQSAIEIINMLQMRAEQATASPAIQQGMTPDNSRSATEIAQQQQGVDKRYSLTAKLYAKSEERFWEVWYMNYDMYFVEGVDAKVMRIVGALGDGYRSVKRKDIIMGTDPEVFVESEAMSEIERIAELQAYANFLQIVQQDPGVNRRYLFRRFAKLNKMSEEEMFLIFPKTPEERLAERENDEMLDGGDPRVSITDDHIAHLEEHNKLSDEGDVGARKKKHMQKHERAMLMVKNNPEIMPALPGVPGGAPGGAPGAQGGAAPLTAQPTYMDYKMPSPVQ